MYYEEFPVDIISDLDPKFNKYLTTQEEQEILEEELKDQYIYFNSFGENLMENKYVSNEILSNLVLYINDLFLIPDIDVLIENSKLLRVFGRFVYEFLCIDLPLNIHPKFFHVPTKDDLIMFISERINKMNTILDDSENNKDIKREIIKWSYYLEIIDGNSQEKVEEVWNSISDKIILI